MRTFCAKIVRKWKKKIVRKCIFGHKRKCFLSNISTKIPIRKLSENGFSSKTTTKWHKWRRKFLYENRPKIDFRAKTTTKITTKLVLRKWWKNGFLRKNYFVLLVFRYVWNGVFYTFKFNTFELRWISFYGSVFSKSVDDVAIAICVHFHFQKSK